MSAGRLSRRQVMMAAGLGVPAAALGAGLATEAPTSGGGSPPVRRARDVRAVLDAVATTDGAGVRLRRALGSRDLPMLDPFLLLDEMHSRRPEEYAAGFPTHPHRGFETVTYVIEGAVDHRDSLGNHGHLGSGSAQWMTAGRGIVHSEMPTHAPDSDRLWGFQLWVNLPSRLKMSAPRYQDIAPSAIPEREADGARVRLVAGEALGTRGPVEGIVTAPTMLDVAITARGRFDQPLPPGHSAFVYVIDGVAEVGPARVRVQSHQIAVLGDGDGAHLRSEDGARLLLCAASPLGEPVARSGPFVMNTEDELRQAWEDYRSGRLVI
jgi:redox-sensitive bicupin YhaK (pirin superfamily)